MTGEKKRYIKIPEQIAHDSKIKPIARLLYGEIDGLAQKSGYCYASNEFFASEYGCSTFAISRYINELVKAGYVRVSVVGRQRRICLTERAKTLAQTRKDPCANGQVLLTERAKTLAQTRKHNIKDNTYINLKDKNISKEAFGQYRNVFLSAIELQTLQSEFPATWSNWIERVSVYCQQKGREYKDYLATIRAWAEKEKQQQQEAEKPKFDDPVLQAMSEWEKAHSL